jgi:hypothetical protein
MNPPWAAFRKVVTIKPQGTKYSLTETATGPPAPEGEDRMDFIRRTIDLANSHYYTNNRKYFTLASFYGEIAKPWSERRLPMVFEPHPDGIEVCKRWKERNR